ncbi:MAG: hypothetical protein H6822_33950 [Planctomycetaceae bacterium]|nr:hypothetical protein [Planctomycetales bacterium]MCB9927192.1 hypothetical protein [Planctomycetaceae bacterium]
MNWRVWIRRAIGVLFTVAGGATLLDDLTLGWNAYLKPAIVAISIALPYLCVGGGLFLLLAPQRVLGVLFDWAKRAVSQAGEQVHVVSFDRPLSSLEWSLSGSRQWPRMRAVEATVIGYSRALTIESEESYGLDHILPSLGRDVRFVEVVAKDWHDDTGIYVRVNAFRKRNFKRWIFIALDERPIKRFSDQEWQVSGRAKSLGGGWQSVLLDLPEAWAKTFGAEGFELREVTDVRLRGSLTLATITFRK